MKNFRKTNQKVFIRKTASKKEMKESFQWKQFLRSAASFFCMGIGIIIVAKSEGEIIPLIVGFLVASIGVALIFSD